MTADGLLDGEAIRRLLGEVADELGGELEQRAMVMVGGSLLACHGLRGSTEDVDSIRKLDERLRSAVHRVRDPAWARARLAERSCNGLRSAHDRPR